MPFTDAWVPTGMKTGVSTSPCAVMIRPVRAGPVWASMLKGRVTWNYVNQKHLQGGIEAGEKESICRRFALMNAGPEEQGTKRIADSPHNLIAFRVNPRPPLFNAAFPLPAPADRHFAPWFLLPLGRKLVTLHRRIAFPGSVQNPKGFCAIGTPRSVAKIIFRAQRRKLL